MSIILSYIPGYVKCQNENCKESQISKIQPRVEQLQGNAANQKKPQTQMMKLYYGLPVVLLGIATVIIQPQVAVTQTPAEVNAIARQITVRIDGTNTGTGVIINRQGNTYSVLTNEHVVRLKGNYTIQTPDGRRYNFNQSIVKYFPGVDLAVLQFNSTENYRTSDLGNSQQLSEGTTIYVAGWADPDAGSSERGYKFLPGGISEIVKNPKEGYAWVYTNQTRQGMSGGPVLDAQGRLVGINGRLQTNPETGATDYFGIPINTYLTLAAKVDGNQRSALPSQNSTTTSPPATISPPRNNNTTSTNFVLANTAIADSTKVDDTDIDRRDIYGVYSVAISPDGRTLASSSPDKTIKIWNLASGQLIRTLTGHSDSVNHVAISPDGRTLVSSSSDKTIKIWNLASGQLIRTLTDNTGGVLAISPDGRTLAIGDLHIKIWNLASGQLIRTLTDDTSLSYFSIAISPDGRTLASGDFLDSIKIWNLASGQLIRTLTGDSDTIFSIAISPDGRTLASSGDKTIKIWNLASGQLIRTVTGHSKAVYSIAISPDGRTLATGSGDKTIKIWNLASGQLIRTLTGHSKAVYSVAISPDSKTLVSGSQDQTIKIWRVSN